MMKRFSLFLFVVVALSCKHMPEKDEFNINTYIKFQANLSVKYADFNRQDFLDRPIDFIDTYSHFCKLTKLNKKSYNIAQAWMLNLGEGQQKKILYYEVVHFVSDIDLNRSILEIKQVNCIDAFNLKLYSIYKIDRHTAIFTNFINFNVKDFESFAQREFNNKLKIEKVNLD